MESGYPGGGIQGELPGSADVDVDPAREQSGFSNMKEEGGLERTELLAEGESVIHGGQTLHHCEWQKLTTTMGTTLNRPGA